MRVKSSMFPGRGLRMLCLTAIAGLCLAGRTHADPDLPGASANLEVIPAGSLIIPMDTNHQALASGAAFNLKAYGLVYTLLRTNIPIKWAIAAGKAKDGVDFSAYVQRLYPSALSATTRSFRAGPFIIHRDFTNNAPPVINAFANSVAVYQLLSNTTLDVRYTLNHRPEIAVLNDGNSQAIQMSVLTAAGIASNTYQVISAADLTSNSCFTFASEPHYAPKSFSLATGQVAGARAFVHSGGNFLAQCAALATYENAVTGLFHTTKGITENNVDQSFVYLTPDLAFSQFQGALEDNGGSVEDWKLATGSAFTNNAHMQIRNITSTNNMAAAAGKLVAGQRGGVVFYLGGHDYKGDTLASINGRRMYLNALFVPTTRANSCGLNFGYDLRMEKDNGVSIARPGELISYLITVTNAGPDDAVGATITDAFPAALTGVVWSSAGRGGAVAYTPSGSGDINILADLPAGGALLFTAAAWVATSPSSCLLSNAATVAGAAGTLDFNPDNNRDDDVDFTQAMTVRGQVRDDEDGDGDLADPDPGLTNILVRFYTDPDADGNPDDGLLLGSLYTDSDGRFAFSNVTPGHYVLEQIDPPNYASTADSAGANDNRIPLTIVCGVTADSTNNIFLDTRLADILGQVRHDIDGDGDLHEVEPGLAGVTLQLYSDPNQDGDPADGVILATTLTDADGNFGFLRLFPGSYVVVETDLPGYVSTGDSDGANDNRVAFLLPGGISFYAVFLDWTLSGLAIVKSSGQDDDFDIAQKVTYSILVTNTRNSTQTSVSIQDFLPGSLNFLNGSAWVLAPAGAARDTFSAIAYTNSDGTLPWSSPWLEEGESDGANAGDIRVTGGRLQIKKVSKGARRSVNLSGYSDAQISFDYDVRSLDDDNDYLRFFASSNGTAWNELHRWSGPLSTQTGRVSFEVASYISPTTSFRFLSSPANTKGSDGEGFFDNVQVKVTQYATGGPPSSLAAGLTLEPGDFLRITFTASVEEVDGIINTARVTTALDPDGLYASVANGVQELLLTQGVRTVNQDTYGCLLAWTAGEAPITRTFDLLWADRADPGFDSSLTDQWAWASTVTNSVYVDTGSVARTPPMAMGHQMRFYRAAREGRWSPGQGPRFASKEIYVAKNIRLEEGENWVSLFMIPDVNTLSDVLGTNVLPAGDQISEATVVEWYGATPSGRATNTIWLSSARTWMSSTGGIVNHRSVPLHEGFNVILPSGSGARNLLVIGKVPTNTSAAFGHAHTLVGSGVYNVVSYNLPFRVRLKDSGLREAGFKGTPPGSLVSPNNSDELRILKRGGGSLASPKARILMNSSTQFVYWTGGTGSAEDYPLEVDDALIVYTRQSASNLNWNLSLPYPVPSININP